MASSRVPIQAALTRTLSTAQRRAPIAGSRVDTSGYTDTGGSGLDATALSSNLHEASAKAVAMYRHALRDIPAMRKNFVIIEDESVVQQCIRDLIERHADVTDPKVVDMLVFKGRQELTEIKEQWKSRHHVYGYIQRYTEKMLREEAGKKMKLGEGDKEDMLQAWRDRGLVPEEIVTWGHYQRWRHEEEGKFRAFAEDNGVFEKGVLQRNASATTGCSVM